MANKFVDKSGITELVNSIASKIASKYATKTNATNTSDGLMSKEIKSSLDDILGEDLNLVNLYSRLSLLFNNEHNLEVDKLLPIRLTSADDLNNIDDGIYSIMGDDRPANYPWRVSTAGPAGPAQIALTYGNFILIQLSSPDSWSTVNLVQSQAGSAPQQDGYVKTYAGKFQFCLGRGGFQFRFSMPNTITTTYDGIKSIDWSWSSWKSIMTSTYPLTHESIITYSTTQTGPFKVFSLNYLGGAFTSNGTGYLIGPNGVFKLKRLTSGEPAIGIPSGVTVPAGSYYCKINY